MRGAISEVCACAGLLESAFRGHYFAQARLPAGLLPAGARFFARRSFRDVFRAVAGVFFRLRGQQKCEYVIRLLRVMPRDALWLPRDAAILRTRICDIQHECCSSARGAEAPLWRALLRHARRRAQTRVRQRFFFPANGFARHAQRGVRGEGRRRVR